jgi:hypothetical protein
MGPMTTRQLALYLLKAKGLDQGGKVLAKSIGLPSFIPHGCF